MVLGKDRLKKMVAAGMVTAAPGIDDQMQTNGIDFTVQSIFVMKGAGSVGFTNEDRVLPQYDEIRWQADGWVQLRPGCYLIKFNEVLALPADLMANTWPRSSMIRMGVSIHLGLGDAGYNGRMEGLMVVHNPAGVRIRRNARVAQLMFQPLDSAQSQADLYNGRYQHENI
jgi:dUTP pyrophosphatase